MNDNIKKLYECKKDTLAKAREFMLGIFETEEQLNMALELFRARYKLRHRPPYGERSEWDTERLQADYTSDVCLKKVFKGIVTDDILLRLQGYDCLMDQIRDLKDFLDDDTAVLIRDHYTVGMDDYDMITIGYLTHFKDGTHIEYWTLTNEYQENGYGTEGNPDSEKKQKAIAYWKQKGMLE